MESIEYFKKQRERNNILKSYISEYTDELVGGSKYVLVNCDVDLHVTGLLANKNEYTESVLNMSTMKVEIDNETCSVIIKVTIHKDLDRIGFITRRCVIVFSSYAAEELETKGKVKLISNEGFPYYTLTLEKNKKYLKASA